MYLTNTSILTIFILSFCLFVFLPSRFRWLLLLFLSVVVLAGNGWSSLIFSALQVLTTFAMGLSLAQEKHRGRLSIFVALQLIPLVIMKLQAPVGFTLAGLPIGLSYTTFQVLSYLIDVSRGKRKAESRLGHFGLFVIFFATKEVGPIERASLIDQFREIALPTADELFRSMLILSAGFVQKFVIADQLRVYVETVFQKPEAYAGAPVWIAVLLSKYQIFADFAGGSSIAIGIGGVFGLTLRKNFDRPFSALSLAEFWRRWHMSLQSWIRDYVFYPLLATPISRFGLFLPVLATYLTFALWHGFRLPLVIYGCLQAVIVIVSPERFLMPRDLRAKIGIPRRTMILIFNYIVLICLPSVLFRMATLSEVWSVWTHLGLSWVRGTQFLALGEWPLILLITFIFASEVGLWAESRYGISRVLSRSPWYGKLILTLVILAFLLVFAKIDQSSHFVYGRF